MSESLVGTCSLLGSLVQTSSWINSLYTVLAILLSLDARTLCPCAGQSYIRSPLSRSTEQKAARKWEMLQVIQMSNEHTFTTNTQISLDTFTSKDTRINNGHRVSHTCEKNISICSLIIVWWRMKICVSSWPFWLWSLCLYKTIDWFHSLLELTGHRDQEEQFFSFFPLLSDQCAPSVFDQRMSGRPTSECRTFYRTELMREYLRFIVHL